MVRITVGRYPRALERETARLKHQSTRSDPVETEVICAPIEQLLLMTELVIEFVVTLENIEMFVIKIS